jgi:hypothetical protein
LGKGKTEYLKPTGAETDVRWAFVFLAGFSPNRKKRKEVR